MDRKHPIVVFLDSNDYSDLSNPKRSEAMEETRRLLIDLSKSPSVSFTFSGMLVSEMAPLESKYTDYAAARTDLMIELCGRNTFLSYDRVIKAEIARLSSMDDKPIVSTKDDGTWFPDIGGVMTPMQFIGATSAINEKGVELGLNRKERRALNCKASRHGRFRKKFVEGYGDFDLTEILSRYPMRPDDAKVIMDYTLGRATAEQADRAFLESMRDPRWMMRWFHEHYDRLGIVGDWVRAPSDKFIAVFSDMIEAGNKLLRFESETGVSTWIDLLSTAGWRSQADQMAITVINRLLQSEHPTSPPCHDTSLIDQYCPGFSTMMSVMNSSLRNSFGPRARKMKRNDFVDAMHAMYAPYATVFRADAYMAPIVRKRVAQYQTTVVEKVEMLPAVIRELMQG